MVSKVNLIHYQNNGVFVCFIVLLLFVVVVVVLFFVGLGFLAAATSAITQDLRHEAPN
jgi:hypothetical protein